MTLQEAINEMKAGKKVKHNYYCIGEYMYLDSDENEYYFECGFPVGEYYWNYIHSNYAFNDGWSIYDETEN